MKYLWMLVSACTGQSWDETNLAYAVVELTPGLQDRLSLLRSYVRNIQGGADEFSAGWSDPEVSVLDFRPEWLGWSYGLLLPDEEERVEAGGYAVLDHGALEGEDLEYTRLTVDATSVAWTALEADDGPRVQTWPVPYSVFGL